MYLCLYLTLNLISFMFEYKVTVTLKKPNLPTVRRFLSLQKAKLPIGVCWPECVDVPDQICQQWETLQELLKHLKASAIARTAFLSCHSKGFYLSLHPPENVIKEDEMNGHHKSQIVLG